MTVFDPASRLDALAAEAPTRTAVRAPGVEWSYGDLAARVSTEAAVLRRSGAAAGTIVELVVPGTPDSVARILAVHAVGATLHPLPQGREPHLGTAGRQAFVVIDTSGTSAAPRSVALTAANIGSAVAGSQERLHNTAHDCWLACLPLHHIGGLSIVYRTLASGGTLLVVPGFAPDVVAEALSGSASFVSLVPTMLIRLLRFGGRFSGVRAALVGGASAGSALVGEAGDAGLPVLQTYGLTEAASQVATVAPGEIEQSRGTVGRPLTGMALSFDGAGQIHVSGPAVFSGYVDAPPRSYAHPTGDLGSMDEVGRLIVTGRADRVIITGGENVSPEWIETVLSAHPAVRAAAVFGKPDAEWGEAVVAVVECSDVTEAELRSWVGVRVARHEVPKVVVVTDVLPRLASGKVDRVAARAAAD